MAKIVIETDEGERVKEFPVKLVPGQPWGEALMYHMSSIIETLQNALEKEFYESR